MAKAKDLQRWLGWFLLVTTFSIACAFLSNWQFNRRIEAQNRIATIEHNYNQTPVALNGLLSPGSSAESLQWRPVEITGRYLLENSVLVRNRPLNGSPGFLEVVPFLMTDGYLIAIERGWIPADSDYGTPLAYPLPSNETQTIVARIRIAEPSLGKKAPLGQLATINVDQLVRGFGLKYEFYSQIYLRMADESKPMAENPKRLPKPQLDEGNHLSYALQWILFALMATAALFWAIRKEISVRNGKAPKVKRDPDAIFEDAVS